METMQGIAVRAQDVRPAWRAVQVDFLAVERSQFATAGRGQWPALSPAYAAAKARRFPGKPIMRRTDALYRSLTTGPQVTVVEPHLLLLGSLVPYGKYHQSRKPRGRLPRRPVIDIQLWTRNRWRRYVAHYVMRGKP